ncbi:hypothetical protein M405DRAFT_99993 [Rhizopogon salebrosus TDB-379]|nr:hypothetical protein M405DRAFT_99993 [Rhizopogon salebrosus TDB-379]
MSTGRIPAALDIHPKVNDDEHGQSLCVRFDDQCVLIPELPHRHRLPKMVTKSYSLPLWKRRSSSLGGSPEMDIFAPEDSHVILRVPIPSFSSKAQSPTRARRSDPKPLSPCLVQRSPSDSSAFPLTGPGSPQCPRRPSRRASLSPSRSDLVTIPLRPCCTACEAVTEASRLQGDTWTEHFSRSARRWRTFSAGESPRTITVEGSVAAASFGLGRGVPISVDEVDKRRRSTDLGVTTEVWLNEGECSTPGEMSAVRTQQPLMIGTQRSSSPLRIPNLSVPSTPRIPEEEDDEDDEDQLFPLPSPRRSPATSPAPSPSASTSCIGLGRPTGSPIPSISSSASLGTKRSKDQFLAPPQSGSSSSLSLAKTTESDDIPPRAPSPHLLATAASISSRPLTPSSTWAKGFSADREQPPPSIPSSASVPMSITSRTRKDSQSPHSHVFSSPSTSPNRTNSPGKRRHGSFSIARPRHIIADVLRGVGAIGGAPGGIGVHV